MKILFASPHCLVDRSSGAALSVATLMRHLSGLGAHCRAVTAAVFDREPASTALEALRRMGAEPLDPGAPAACPWTLSSEGLHHEILPLARLSRDRLRPADEAAYLDFAKERLAAIAPDVLIQYGGGDAERALAREARSQGALTVFYLANPTYHHPGAFADIDLVVTDTEATARLYRERLGLAPVVIGKFVDPPPAIHPSGPADRITFVNPTLEKGATLFFRIVELARSALPTARFLVVESRGALHALESRHGLPFSALDTIETVGLQPDLGAVLARTRVLLLPSLWHESGPRTVLEAMSLGIPVLASDVGGVAEIVGGGGIVIPPPERLQVDPARLPTSAEAILWVEALRHLMQPGPDRDEAVARARAAAARHDPVVGARNLFNVLKSRRQAIQTPRRSNDHHS